MVELIDIPPSLMRSDLDRRTPENARFQDLTGQPFEHCKVLGLAGFLMEYATWLCECKCGNQFLRRQNSLAAGRSSCGCAHQTHGLSGLPIYRTWSGMLARCYRPSNKQYKNYGARGIKVCDRWRKSAAAFVEDMGPKPTPNHSLDRIDNNGDYCKENCRWATPKEQWLNKRGIRWIECNGEVRHLSEWADKIGLTRERLRQRLDRCLELDADITEAITTPVGEAMPCIVAMKNQRSLAKLERINSREYEKASRRERLLELCDGNVHYLLRIEADELAGGLFDAAIRNLCSSQGMRPSIRHLDGHLLFQAK